MVIWRSELTVAKRNAARHSPTRTTTRTTEKIPRFDTRHTLADDALRIAAPSSSRSAIIRLASRFALSISNTFIRAESSGVASATPALAAALAASKRDSATATAVRRAFDVGAVPIAFTAISSRVIAESALRMRTFTRARSVADSVLPYVFMYPLRRDIASWCHACDCWARGDADAPVLAEAVEATPTTAAPVSASVAIRATTCRRIPIRRPA